MNIKNHGQWSLYRPDPLPEHAPPNALFARRASDGKDWYKYLREEGSFTEGSIILTVYQGDIVGTATRDPTAIFPGHDARVLEIIGVEGIADPLKEFGNKLYDEVTGEFHEPPPPQRVQGPSVEELLKRIEALEAKG